MSNKNTGRSRINKQFLIKVVAPEPGPPPQRNPPQPAGLVAVRVLVPKPRLRTARLGFVGFRLAPPAPGAAHPQASQKMLNSFFLARKYLFGLILVILFAYIKTILL